MPDHILLDAVWRNLEIIGEASRKIGPDFRTFHPTLPWRERNDLRNVLIDNYDGVDPALVWGVVRKQVPQMLAEVEKIIAAT